MIDIYFVLSLCKLVEEYAPASGAHVALTGGWLYKKGPRKDIDLLFYRIRQSESINREQLLDSLKFLGFEIGKQYGWVTKSTYKGINVDLFFPELHPEVLEPGPSASSLL